MLGRGAMKGLKRERHPLVALALVALLVPYLFLVGGLHVHSDAFHLGDGTVVICTGDGFERVAAGDLDGGPGDDGAPCCGAFCAHSAPAAITGDSPQPIFEAAVATAPPPGLAGLAGPSERSFDSIRGPPPTLA